MEIDKLKVSLENGFYGNSAGKVTNIADSLANETVGFEQLSISQTVTALTPEVYGDAIKAVICIEDSPIRFLTTGNDPSGSVGLLALSNTYIVLEGRWEVENFKCIASTGTAKLSIEYKC